MKGKFLHFIYDINHLLELVDMDRSASLEHEEEISKLTLIWRPPMIL